jgi:hypothetical protein
VGAQTGLHAVTAHVRHELLGDMAGGALMVSPGRSRIRFGPELLTSSSTAVRSTCAGLIAPHMDCDPEPTRMSGQIRAALIEAGVHVLKRTSVDVELLGAARLGDVRSRVQGLESARELRASKLVVGIDIGVATSWYPWLRRRAGFQFTASVGGLNPFPDNQVVDGYTPFENNMSIRRASLGFVIRD